MGNSVRRCLGNVGNNVNRGSDRRGERGELSFWGLQWWFLMILQSSYSFLAEPCGTMWKVMERFPWKGIEGCRIVWKVVEQWIWNVTEGYRTCQNIKEGCRTKEKFVECPGNNWIKQDDSARSHTTGWLGMFPRPCDPVTWACLCEPVLKWKEALSII